MVIEWDFIVIIWWWFNCDLIELNGDSIRFYRGQREFNYQEWEILMRHTIRQSKMASWEIHYTHEVYSWENQI